PTGGGNCGAKYPVDSASRYCGRAARPRHFALTAPLRLQPPMAASDLGLALPCELSDRFPAPPDFSTGTFHNRSPHNWSIHEQGRGALVKRGFSPLFTGDTRLSVAPKQRWGRLPQCAVVIDPRDFLRGTLRFLCRGRLLN